MTACVLRTSGHRLGPAVGEAARAASARCRGRRVGVERLRSRRRTSAPSPPATIRTAGTPSMIEPSPMHSRAGPSPTRPTATFGGGHAHRQVGGRRADLQGPREDRDVRAEPDRSRGRAFEDVGRADGVGEDHLARRGGTGPGSGPRCAAAGRSAGRRGRRRGGRRSRDRPGWPSRDRPGWRRGPGRRPGDGPGVGR